MAVTVFSANGISKDVLNYQDVVTAAGGSVNNLWRPVVDRLVRDLKTCKVWWLLDRLWIHATLNAPGATICLKSLSALTPVAAPAFTQFRGYTGDGVASYLDSNYNAVTATGVKRYVKDDMTTGVWVNTAATSTSGFEIANDFGAYSFIATRWTATDRRWEIQGNTNVSAPVAHGGILTGMFNGVRMGNAYSILYRNGVPLMTSAAPGNAPSNRNFFMLGYVHVATPSNFSNAQISASWIGGAMDPEQQGLFYNAMRTYMTAVGVA